MLVPFDDWCAFTIDPTTTVTSLSSKGVLCDVALAFRGTTCVCSRNVGLQPLACAPSSRAAPAAASSNIVLHVHRLLLFRELPSYFAPLICSPSTGMYIREDRLSAQVTTVGVPVVVRFLYTGNVGAGRLICGLESTLRGEQLDDAEQANRSLSTVDLLHALIVSLAWATAVPSMRQASCGFDSTTAKWASAEVDDHRETAATKLHGMALTLFDSLCSVTELAQLDEKTELCEPPSQLPASSQMPSQRPRTQAPPAIASPDRQFLELVRLLAALDDAISSQAAHNRVLQASCAHSFPPPSSTTSGGTKRAPEEAVVGPGALSCCTSHFFAPFSIDPTARALESASSVAAASQLYEDIENHLVSPHSPEPCDVKLAVSAGDVLGFLWVRVREALVALGAQCIGTRTLVSFLPEMASSTPGVAPTLAALEVVRAHAGNPSSEAGCAASDVFILGWLLVGGTLWISRKSRVHRSCEKGSAAYSRVPAFPLD